MTSPKSLLSRSLAALLLVALAAVAAADVPKVGEFYQDKTDLGFKVQMPRDYDLVPPQPGDPNLVAKYVAPRGGGLYINGAGVWPMEAHIVKFDRRPTTGSTASKKKGQPAAKDVATYVKQNFAGGDFKEEWKSAHEKKLKVGKLDATEYWFDNVVADTKVRLYATVIALTPELDVALVFNGPGEDKKWNKYENVYQQMSKSLRPLEVVGKPTAEAGGSLRERKLARIQDELTRLPGWTLYETPNYFVISNNPDEQFIEELKVRLEAIRKVYEEVYSAENAQALRARAAEYAKENPKKDDKKTGPHESSVGEVDPMEASRTCVVRVCSDRDMYDSYGGPPSSAGYWSAYHEELVIFDDKKEGGRSNTWKTLNHEAFHQYIYYFYGNLSPHSWFNEGTGDFYSGYEFGKTKRFTLKPFDWRVQKIKEAVRNEAHAPLEKLVRYTQAEYYEPSTRGQNYAQGWSFIYFLRTGPTKSRCFNDAWNQILPTYLEVLMITRDLDQAVDKAFAGVDFDELEKCWKEYVDKGF